jgi:hypothetical protein
MPRLDKISISKHDIDMTRTVIALEPDIKQWLDQKALQEGVPMTELVRRAVRLLQEQENKQFDSVLLQSAGIWTEGDGLDYQVKLRREWPGHDDPA